MKRKQNRNVAKHWCNEIDAIGWETAACLASNRQQLLSTHISEASLHPPLELLVTPHHDPVRMNTEV